ncbi:MAG: type II toxin-antitoxin system PemK/MazF family toxin [Actinobacteria bacterium]|nr:type II toxin-antitoxin system PemK/MazF family toxin [Actinomycetota bacterium]
MSFRFTDEAGVKRRPSVIISTDTYHRDRQEVIVAAITSNINRLLVGDHFIDGWRDAGLLHPSVATGIIRTVKQEMIHHKLGDMPSVDMQAIDDGLRQAVGL